VTWGRGDLPRPSDTVTWGRGDLPRPSATVFGACCKRQRPSATVFDGCGKVRRASVTTSAGCGPTRRASATASAGRGQARRATYPGRRCACPGLMDPTPVGVEDSGAPPNGLASAGSGGQQGSAILGSVDTGVNSDFGQWCTVLPMGTKDTDVPTEGPRGGRTTVTKSRLIRTVLHADERKALRRRRARRPGRREGPGGRGARAQGRAQGREGTGREVDPGRAPANRPKRRRRPGGEASADGEPIMLSQPEADRLILMEKRKLDENVWGFPDWGGSVSVPVESVDRSERFLFDLGRGRIKLSKLKYQERYIIYQLVRLDIDGADHMNPDGAIVPCPHLHRYREGYGDSWAEPCPTEFFTDLSNIRTTLYQFFEFCHVVAPPRVDVGVI